MNKTISANTVKHISKPTNTDARRGETEHTSRSVSGVKPIAIPKRAAAINDLTGFGRCSLAVVLPVISAMGVQACPVPTSIFSSHMGFPSYYYQDLSEGLSSYLDGYDSLQLTFDGIYCGFLNSTKQFQSVRRFLEQQRQKSSPVILIDPVMGDLGKPYRIVTRQHCLSMKQLISYATILTPNLTEACLLTDTPFPKTTPDTAFLHRLSERLVAMGPDKVAITGIMHDMHVINYCVEKEGSRLYSFLYQTPSNGESWPGTGDIFASILTADALNGVPFASSVRRAADFIRLCVEGSHHIGVPIREGVLFEPYLSALGRDCYEA